MRALLLLALLSSAAATWQACSVSATVNFESTECGAACQASAATHQALAQYAQNGTGALTTVPAFDGTKLVLTWTFSAADAAWCSGSYAQWAAFVAATQQARWGGRQWVENLDDMTFELFHPPPAPTEEQPPPPDSTPTPAPVILPPAASPSPAPRPPSASRAYARTIAGVAVAVPLVLCCCWCLCRGAAVEQRSYAAAADPYRRRRRWHI